MKRLLSQLERSEKARGETEIRLAETTKALKLQKDVSEKTNSVKEKLQV